MPRCTKVAIFAFHASQKLPFYEEHIGQALAKLPFPDSNTSDIFSSFLTSKTYFNKLLFNLLQSFLLLKMSELYS